jgi:cytochrome c
MSGLNTKKCATCHPSPTLALYTKNTRHKGYVYPPINCCAGWNVHSLMSGLDDTTCGQQAIKAHGYYNSCDNLL